MARILIADDSAAARRALRNLVEWNDWEVCGEAEDGLAAVEKAAILKPDLVILDFSMPKLNGLQAGHTDPYRRSSRPATALHFGDDRATPWKIWLAGPDFGAHYQRVKVFSPYRRLSRSCFRVRLSFLQHQQRCGQRTHTMAPRVRRKKPRRSEGSTRRPHPVLRVHGGNWRKQAWVLKKSVMGRNLPRIPAIQCSIPLQLSGGFRSRC